MPYRISFFFADLSEFPLYTVYLRGMGTSLFYKNVFTVNSAEHGISNTFNILRKSAFSGSDKPRMLFFLLINVKTPTIVLPTVFYP